MAMLIGRGRIILPILLFPVQQRVSDLWRPVSLPGFGQNSVQVQLALKCRKLCSYVDYWGGNGGRCWCRLCGQPDV